MSKAEINYVSCAKVCAPPQAAEHFGKGPMVTSEMSAVTGGKKTPARLINYEINKDFDKNPALLYFSTHFGLAETYRRPYS